MPPQTEAGKTFSFDVTPNVCGKLRPGPAIQAASADPHCGQPPPHGEASKPELELISHDSRCFSPMMAVMLRPSSRLPGVQPGPALLSQVRVSGFTPGWPFTSRGGLAALLPYLASLMLF